MSAQFKYLISSLVVQAFSSTLTVSKNLANSNHTLKVQSRWLVMMGSTSEYMYMWELLIWIGGAVLVNIKHGTDQIDLDRYF